ncbi:MAG: cupin domain-containing protein [Anaeromyxobacter sp.]
MPQHVPAPSFAPGSRQPAAVRQGPNFSSADYGPSAGWSEYLRQTRIGPFAGKVFLGQTLGMTGTEVSFGLLQPGQVYPFFHAHKQNEELYVFLSGQGELLVDGERIPVSAGSAVRIAPPALRSWRATGPEPLAYLCIQAKAGSLDQATATDGVLSDQPAPW